LGLFDFLPTITFPNIGLPTKFGLCLVCYFVLVRPQKDWHANADSMSEPGRLAGAGKAETDPLTLVRGMSATAQWACVCEAPFVSLRDERQGISFPEKLACVLAGRWQ
jgi:hypothetical protein